MMRIARSLAWTSCVALVLTFGVSIPAPSLSSTIERYSDTEMGCRLRLSGTIETGDAEILETRIQEVLTSIPERGNYHDTDGEYPEFAVCFDSPGGSLIEGVRIAQILNRNQVSSAVPADASCESACAVAFMGGARDASNSDEFFTVPHRLLHPNGRLGFHAPSLGIDEGQFTSDQLNTAFQAALGSIEAVLRLATEQQINFPPSLLVSMLETPPSNMFYIDTIYQANRWKIIAQPVPYPTRSPIRALTYACLSADIFGTEISLEDMNSWLDWAFDPHGSDSVLNPWLSAVRPDGEGALAYAGDLFSLSVLPMWSFTDAPPSPCLISRDLSYAYLREAMNFRHIYPFQFYSPETRISGLPSTDAGSGRRLIAETDAVYSRLRSSRATSCWLTSPTVRIVHVTEYVNLRRQPDFSSPVIRQVPLSEQVRALRADNITIIGQERERQSCLSACRAFGANREDRAARDRVEQCINDNMLWYEVTDARNNRGWVSRRYLEEVR
jgi:ATP-dependent protease ClpP protease subunit